MQIVGVAVLPEVSERGRLGKGLYTTVKGLARLDPDFVPEPSGIFVRPAPGSDAETVLDELERSCCDGLQEQYPYCSLSYVRVQAPSDIVNFGRAQNVQLCMGGVLAFLAGGTLAHVAVSVIRQHRRRLAVLKVLGFARGQLAASIAVQGAPSPPSSWSSASPPAS